MLANYRKFKLSAQTEHIFFANILCMFYEHFLSHFVSVFRQYIIAEKNYSSASLNIRNIYY